MVHVFALISTRCCLLFAMAPGGSKTTKPNSNSVDETDMLTNISKQIAELFNEMQGMRAEQRSLATSLESTHEDINDCKLMLKEQKLDIKRCSDDVEALKMVNNTLKKQICELKHEVAALQQYSRANCIDIRGVPEQKFENITEVVLTVTRAIRFKLESWMIDAVHRLAGNTTDSRPRGIILKLVRRVDYNELLRLAKVKKGFSASELGYVSDSKIYINPSMSKENKALLAAAREKARTSGYRYVWFVNGKIMVRKAQGQPAILITSKEQLDQVIKHSSTGLDEGSVSPTSLRHRGSTHPNSLLDLDTSSASVSHNDGPS